ncbi:MAG: hypothetical protein GWN48_02135, partial [Actinobacteria bacterium]|nr:hypothetical protein [Actinomycetota bacterium]
MVTNGEDLFQVVLAMVVFLLAYGAPAFFVAVLARRLAPATGVYLGVMFASQGVGRG